MNQGDYSEAFVLLAELAAKLGATPLNQHPGCWEHELGPWHFAINAHREDRVARDGATVPPFHALVTWEGWPAALMSPRGGVVLAGRDGVSAEGDLIAALREALAES